MGGTKPRKNIEVMQEAMKEVKKRKKKKAKAAPEGADAGAGEKKKKKKKVEKALFRALKTKGNTPKYGLIFHSTFIGRAQQKNKGRISRYLVNKCSIASRIDCFSEEATTVFGEKLRDQVEERLNFLSEGTTPRKNLEVMQEALKEVTKQKKKKAKASPKVGP